MAITRDEPLVPVPKPKDAGDAIAEIALRDEASDDVVEPRAQTAAGDDRGRCLRCIEENLFARPGEFESERHIEPTLRSLGMIHQHAIRVRLKWGLDPPYMADR